jgi:Lhr-like helicase
VKNKIKECNGIDLKIKALEEENRRLRDKIKELQRESSQKNIFEKDVRNEKTYSAYLRHCANREKLFSRKKRSYGNFIMFESNNLATASMKTKLELREMVDRGAFTPNEWREVFNLAPVPGGDQPIRRLDTAVVEQGKEQ